MSWDRRLILAIPLIWMGLFLLIPFWFILKISLAEPVVASPPFTPLLQLSGTLIHISLNLKNYWFILTHYSYLLVLLSSIKIALIATIVCILIGYPLAYAIVKTTPRWRAVLFFLMILPYWTSFLLRAYAWIVILQNNGLINQLLQALHLTHMPVHLLYNDFSVYLGLVYGYLPFFVLPLYATLVKLDNTYLEAAYDLGCSPLKAFFTITVPLSAQGIIAGALLVFIPCVGEVVVPQILGGIHTLMIGNVIWQGFFVGNNWCLSSALAIGMLVILVVPIVWFQKIQRKAGLHYG